MRFAVFYRNVNLGRPKLEAALENAGAVLAYNFQTNGTAVFDAEKILIRVLRVDPRPNSW